MARKARQIYLTFEGAEMAATLAHYQDKTLSAVLAEACTAARATAYQEGPPARRMSPKGYPVRLERAPRRWRVASYAIGSTAWRALRIAARGNGRTIGDVASFCVGKAWDEWADSFVEVES